MIHSWRKMLQRHKILGFHLFSIIINGTRLELTSSCMTTWSRLALCLRTAPCISLLQWVTKTICPGVSWMPVTEPNPGPIKSCAEILNGKSENLTFFFEVIFEYFNFLPDYILRIILEPHGNEVIVYGGHNRRPVFSVGRQGRDAHAGNRRRPRPPAVRARARRPRLRLRHVRTTRRSNRLVGVRRGFVVALHAPDYRSGWHVSLSLLKLSFYQKIKSDERSLRASLLLLIVWI